MRVDQGLPLPPKLASELLATLQGLQWMGKQQRPSLESSNYLVLTRK